MKEALFYEKLNNNIIKCTLCPKFCTITPNHTGFCLVRKNINGKLYTLNDKISSIAIDPIEKKPLYHFYPFSKTLSIGTNGCNFDCDFCQNFEISRNITEKYNYTEKDIVELALSNQIPIIAYTYNEPTVFYEFMLNTMKLAKKNNLKNIIISNGYINKKPLLKLIPYLDAANIDVKGNNKFYNKICNGSLKEIKETIEELNKYKIWLETTFLVIPKYNDNSKDAEKIFKWLSKFNYPLHILRYYPMRKKISNITPLSTLEKLKRIAEKYLDYVYIGNAKLENTYCKKCKKLVIDRTNKTINFCEHTINGIFNKTY